MGHPCDDYMEDIDYYVENITGIMPEIPPEAMENWRYNHSDPPPEVWGMVEAGDIPDFIGPVGCYHCDRFKDGRFEEKRKSHLEKLHSDEYRQHLEEQFQCNFSTKTISETGGCVDRPWEDYVSCEAEKDKGKCRGGADPNEWVIHHCEATCGGEAPFYGKEHLACMYLKEEHSPRNRRQWRRFRRATAGAELPTVELTPAPTAPTPPPSVPTLNASNFSGFAAGYADGFADGQQYLQEQR